MNFFDGLNPERAAKEQQARLSEQPWALLQDKEAFCRWTARLREANPLCRGPHMDEVPAEFPCLAKSIISGNTIFVLLLNEQDAIEFLKRVKTADKLESGEIPQTQDNWNQQVNGLLMAIIQLLITRKICTEEQFEILNMKCQQNMEQAAAEAREQGKDNRTAEFRREVRGLR